MSSPEKKSYAPLEARAKSIIDASKQVAPRKYNQLLIHALNENGFEIDQNTEFFNAENKTALLTSLLKQATLKQQDTKTLTFLAHNIKVDDESVFGFDNFNITKATKVAKYFFSEVAEKLHNTSSMVSPTGSPSRGNIDLSRSPSKTNIR